jgi:hypothetical protein
MDGTDRGDSPCARDVHHEHDWALDRRRFAAALRGERAAGRERLARRREQLADERQEAAERRPQEADGSWDYRERARQARKDATEYRASAEASRQRAQEAMREAHDQYPLAARFAELAGHLFASGSLEEVLARIAAAATEVIDGVDLASISLLTQGGRISTPAATDPLAVRLDELQYACGEGPCLEIGLNPQLTYLSVADVSVHPDWPVFGPKAGAHGIHAMLSLGLFPRGTEAPEVAREQPRLGALNLYARQPHAFDHNARDVGLLLAAHAAVAVAGTQNTDQLRAALDSRDVIGQAKGILMARRNLTADQAFDVLRRTSQRLNVKLHDVATRVADTGEAPD